MSKLSVDEVQKKKDAGIRLSKKENFQLLAKKASKSYYANGGWSSLELGFKLILEGEGVTEKKDYIHNYKIPNGLFSKKGKEGKFELDFFFPSLQIGLELNPMIWHTKLGNTEAKDARKWIQMEKQGIMPLFIDNISAESLVELARKIAKLLKVEYQYFRECWSQIYKEE